MLDVIVVIAGFFMVIKYYYDKRQAKKMDFRRKREMEERERWASQYTNSALELSMIDRRAYLPYLRMYEDNKEYLDSVVGEHSIIGGIYNLGMKASPKGKTWLSELTINLLLSRQGYITCISTSEMFATGIRTGNSDVTKEIFGLLRVIERNMDNHGKPIHFSVLTTEVDGPCYKEIVVREFYNPDLSYHYYKPMSPSSFRF